MHFKFRIMYLHIFGFFVIKVILDLAAVQGIIKSDCPISCNCDSSKKTVDCSEAYWKKLPDLPTGTKRVSICMKNFGVLYEPTSCDAYKSVVALDFTLSSFTVLADDVFKCMPRIKFLVLDWIKLDDLPGGVFRHVPNLANLSLEYIELSAGVIPEVCTIQKLENVKFIGNWMSIIPGTLECLGLLKNLSDIDLSKNKISGSVTQVLRPLRNVSNYISVGNCGISSLENDTFDGFMVEFLDLSNNEISYIPRHAFTTLANLKTLQISNTRLSETWDWSKIPPLQKLDLQSSKISGLLPVAANISAIELSACGFHKLDSGSFANLHNLVKLLITGNGISIIERHAFYNLPNLEELNVSFNNISGKSLSNIFGGLVNSSLKVLDLSFNPLRDLNKIIFDNFTANRLEKISLKCCDIEAISSNIFNNFLALRELVLSENFIKYLDPHAFRHLSNLITLHLNTNNIQALPLNLFSGLTRLETLTLYSNMIADFDGALIGLNESPIISLNLGNNQISAFVFQNSSTLTDIDLSQNYVSVISSNTFRNLSSLKNLKMALNPLYMIEKDAFETLENINWLDFAESKEGMFQFLPKSFWKMPRLEILVLSQSYIGRLTSKQQEEIWEKSYQLKELAINDCKIGALFPGMFSSLGLLDNLYARSNQISYVEKTAFRNLSILRVLDLDHNSISYVNWDSFAFLPNLRRLSLSNNPLLCTCEVLWLYQSVTTPYLVFITGEDDVVCGGPISLLNIKVKDIKLSVFDCEDHWLDILKVIGVGIAITIMFLIMYTFWRYRWHLRYTLFLARAGRGRYEEMNDGQYYVNDAFVAYSIEDLIWVKDHLLPNVDSEYIGEDGYKLCLHHRDWLVGVDIAENIVKSIAESRRTILVLSKDFAASYWCRFELATAHMRLDAEGHMKDRLLVILLHDIPNKLLTPRIIHILGSKTYLAWPEDPGMQPAFWKTIRKSLKREVLYN